MRVTAMFALFWAYSRLGTPTIAQFASRMQDQENISCSLGEESVSAFTRRAVNLELGNAVLICNTVLLHTKVDPKRIHVTCNQCTVPAFLGFTTNQPTVALQIGDAIAVASEGCSLRVSLYEIGAQETWATGGREISMLGPEINVREYTTNVVTLLIGAEGYGIFCEIWIQPVTALSCHGLNALLLDQDCASAINIHRPLQGTYDDKVYRFTCYRVFSTMHRYGCLDSLDTPGTFSGWQL